MAKFVSKPVGLSQRVESGGSLNDSPDLVVENDGQQPETPNEPAERYRRPDLRIKSIQLKSSAEFFGSNSERWTDRMADFQMDRNGVIATPKDPTSTHGPTYIPMTSILIIRFHKAGSSWN